MQTNSFIANVTQRIGGATSFKVDHLTDVATNSSAQYLLDRSVVYADRDALQTAIAGRLCVDFPDVRIRVANYN